MTKCWVIDLANSMQKQVVSRYAADEISYETLEHVLGNEETERLRIYKETILESFNEADIVAKRLKCD